MDDLERSEREFVEFLERNNLPWDRDTKVQGGAPTPDFGFALEGERLIAEVKECGPIWPDAHVISSAAIGAYGSHEGRLQDGKRMSG